MGPYRKPRDAVPPREPEGAMKLGKSAVLAAIAAVAAVGIFQGDVKAG